MLRSTLRIGMLISGGGTTAAAIIRACQDGVLRGIAEPAFVISSRRNAPGIQRVIDAGMVKHNVVVLRPRAYKNPDEFGAAILRFCEMRKVDFLGQYGWLPKTPVNVIEWFQRYAEGRMVNQHPGPLDPGYPDFGGEGMYGLRVHCARLYFVRALGHDFFTEATAQRVHPEYDKGVVLARQSIQIPYYPRETAKTLASRLLPVEHQLHISVIRDFAEGRVYECVRSIRLVRPHEIPIWEEAKRVAKVLYPQG